VPIERENIGNLLKEILFVPKNTPTLTLRLQITLYYMQFYLKADGMILILLQVVLSPIFFGTGASVKYRHRSSYYILTYGFYGKWKILKSVYISKQFLSQAIDQSLLNM
jgi:hypothetical protein